MTYGQGYQRPQTSIEKQSPKHRLQDRSTSTSNFLEYYGCVVYYMYPLSHHCSSFFWLLGLERVCWRNWSGNTIPSDTIRLPIWKHRLERWVNFSPSKRRRYVITIAFLKCSDQVTNENRTGAESYYRKDWQPWWFQDIYAKLCVCTGFSTTSRSASGGTFRRRFRESIILFVTFTTNPWHITPQLPPLPTFNDKTIPSTNHQHTNGSDNIHDKGRPTFGVDLAEQMTRDNVEVPPIMQKCCEAIEKYGIQSQGIYRLSGTTSKVANLKQKLDRGQPLFLILFLQVLVTWYLL